MTTSTASNLIDLLAVKPGDLCKDDEVAILAAFVEAVPRNSYLIDYMQGAVEHFERLVRIDLIEPLTSRHRDVAESLEDERNKLKELKQQVAAEQTKLKDAQRSLFMVKRDVAEINNQAQTMRSSIDSIRQIAATIQKD